MGDIFYLLGKFLIMLIFMGVAIRTQKKKWFTIGAVFQLLSLGGMTLDPNDSIEEKIICWVIYIAILLITAFVMKRGNKNSNTNL